MSESPHASGRHASGLDADAVGGLHADVVEQWQTVRAELAQAAQAAKRQPEDVQLVAVSKTHPAERIAPLLEAGHRLFGENRVQEAESKWPGLRRRWPDLKLHLIGPLQSNKVREAVALFDAIETVDREKLARALATEMVRSGRVLECFIQVNTGAESQKAGVLPGEADGLIRLCRDELALNVAGLMCIPPVEEDPARHFDLLAAIAARHGLQGLSMGMSGDYPAAIAHGATHVRVGTAIFGKRPPLKPA
ncbi:MAG TPA: YggS family pyridoxal phosphate-dependent enzyme [Candidatus Sulfotelmatobacter sp.]|nr:YggS family pyridoxal phosphate-dependent enzyme [Candidatus Sulfotelmatobacter sp.]